MSALFRGLHQLKLSLLRRQDLLRQQGIGRLDGVTPLFERKPHWSTRFTYPLVLTQLAISIAGAELIVDHWTREVEPPADTSSKKSEPEYELRPIWQRIPLALGQAVIGAYICTILLNTRARIIRRAYILPGTSVTRSAPFAPQIAKAAPRVQGAKAGAASNADRVVVLQNVWHWRGQGNVFPFSACRLERARDDAEAMLTVDGVEGRFFLPLSGGKVNGEDQPAELVRDGLFRAWYGPKKAREMARQAWGTAGISQ